jgi:uncharacterized protein (TIGR00290 family)
MTARAATRYGLATAAGKDATLALHRARADGLEVPFAFCIYDPATERIRFHGTRLALVEAHAGALGLELLALPAEADRFEPVFLDALARLKEMGAGGVVFGNIHLADVRAWYEERTTAAGLEHVEPLWGERPGELVREGLALGYRATLVSVDLAQGDPAWAGRELTLALVTEMEARGVDPCGERGEYHTFVFDGPLFHEPVGVETGETVERDGHRLVDLVPRPGRAQR